MQQIIPQTILGNNFLISTERAIYWGEKKTLILSDLHFGKTGHFRKAGIAVPQSVFKEDIQRFVSLLQSFKPQNVIVIGDMFHSHDNKEHEFFFKWRKDFRQLHIQLVMGNHDILLSKWYHEAGITTIRNKLEVGCFSFVHDINDTVNNNCDEAYVFSGHIHPGISIHGISKQSLSFPCFYFAKQYAVLPAFSKFTGYHPIKPKRGENVYAIIPPNIQKAEQGGLLKVY
jgi:DNA ligase-associated metallophosphoesterase